ncbi:hypothetical protein B0H17DRAFT_1137049 [Mycena rosella]|uniref:Uncharacterized protein n=1 Tax=Mycena rosella TaxID=1033263 RepID=A0AAD7D980_MYCRO|nr:hypothetical protein B0H17DRAFT_1137049 [Mycena rosella]
MEFLWTAESARKFTVSQLAFHRADTLHYSHFSDVRRRMGLLNNINWAASCPPLQTYHQVFVAVSQLLVTVPRSNPHNAHLSPNIPPKPGGPDRPDMHNASRHFRLFSEGYLLEMRRQLTRSKGRQAALIATKGMPRSPSGLFPSGWMRPPPLGLTCGSGSSRLTALSSPSPARRPGRFPGASLLYPYARRAPTISVLIFRLMLNLRDPKLAFARALTTNAQSAAEGGCGGTDIPLANLRLRRAPD